MRATLSETSLECIEVLVNWVGFEDIEFLEIDWMSGRLLIPSVRHVAVSCLLGSLSLFAASPEVLRATTGEAVVIFRSFTGLSLQPNS